MKKTIYVLFVFAFVCFFSFVKSTLAVVPAPISQQGLGIVTVNGKIESISRECPSEGVMAMIIIVDKKGKRVAIEVKADTVIYDEEGKTIPLDKVQKGDKVIIEYREAKKTEDKAESIKLTK
jgi:hypothetical protein